MERLKTFPLSCGLAPENDEFGEEYLRTTNYKNRYWADGASPHHSLAQRTALGFLISAALIIVRTSRRSAIEPAIGLLAPAQPAPRVDLALFRWGRRIVRPLA